RVRADLQRAVDRLFSTAAVSRFFGVRMELSTEGLNLADCIAGGSNPFMSAVVVPPQYEEIDVGDDEPVRCLKNGLWFLKEGRIKYVVLLAPAAHFGQTTGMQVQIAVVSNEDGTRITQQFFRDLEDSVQRSESYRGKVLSLEESEPSYFGKSAGIT